MSKLPGPKGALPFFGNAIHIAASGYFEILELHCERGAGMDIRNHEGKTPLHIAVGYGQAKIVRFLCERGADIKAQNSEGLTALEAASRQGYLEIASILRQYQERRSK